MIPAAAPQSAYSHRSSSLTMKFKDKSYRHSYMSSHIKTFLASQLRAFRGKMSQAEFGRKIGKPQPVVNRNENASYGKFTLQNLFDYAEKLDVAVHVRFVDFPTFVKLTENLSEAALKPEPYSEGRKVLPSENIADETMQNAQFNKEEEGEKMDAAIINAKITTVDGQNMSGYAPKPLVATGPGYPV